MPLGLEILRFSNRDIDRDFRNVWAQIDLIRVFNKTLKSVLLGRRIAASGHCR